MRTVVRAQVDDELIVAVVGAGVGDCRKVVVLQRGQARSGRLAALGVADDRHALRHLARAARAATIAAACSATGAGAPLPRQQETEYTHPTTWRRTAELHLPAYRQDEL